MPNFQNIESLFLFVIFVIPGAIGLATYNLLNPGSQKNSGQILIDAVTYSLFNYAILLGPIYWAESSQWKENCPVIYVMFYVFVLLGAPVIEALAIEKFRKTETGQRFMPHPTLKAWDYVFSQRKEYWVVVSMKNGNKIAGYYGPDSFASSAPAQEQIYLERSWVIDDEGFDREKNHTAGVMIVSSDIEKIE
ncbi:MAG: DUF6338 family protein, partial [Zoogloeaceae bacterium]|nr:DUF6338 family protein [Zoogloeaceae bacterium]